MCCKTYSLISSYNFYYKKTSANVSNSVSVKPLYLIIDKTIEEVGTPSSNTKFATLYGIEQNTFRIKIYSFVIDTLGNLLQNSVNETYSYLTETAQTIWGVKTFDSLPESSTAPTTNNQFANKKYVDDSISSAIGSINTILATLTTPSNGGE